MPGGFEVGLGDLESENHAVGPGPVGLEDLAEGPFRHDDVDGGLDARVVRQAMETYAQEGNAIIVGRGGQMILNDRPDALHVHLYASLEVRVQRLMERYGISELEAKRRIKGSDERKRLVIRNLHNNANWKDLKHYHLAINTGGIAPEVAAKIIMQAAKYRERAAV